MSKSKKFTPKSGNPIKRAAELQEREDRINKKTRSTWRPSTTIEPKEKEVATLGGMFTVPSDLTADDDVKVPNYIRNADRKAQDKERSKVKNATQKKNAKKFVVAGLVILVAITVVASGMSGLFVGGTTTIAPVDQSTNPSYAVENQQTETLPVDGFTAN